MDIKEALGKKIKDRRVSLGLTQKVLSDGIISRNMLSLIESGRALPSLLVVLALADRLKITPGYLLSDKSHCLKY